MTVVSRRTERAVGALAAIVLVFGVLPATLIAVARERFGSASPLAGVPAAWRWDLAEIGRAASEPLSDGAVADLLVRSSLVLAWVAVGVILFTTIAETAHMVRYRGIGLPPVRGLGWAQRISRLIATGLIALAPLHTPRVSIASVTGDAARYELILPGDATPGIGATEAGPRTPTPADDEAAPHDIVHVVRRGESVYSIASDLARGDPSETVPIAEAILDANLGRTMPGGGRFTNPAYIEIGWRLTIPGDILPTVDGRDGPPSHVVAPDDTLSGIAHLRLGDADSWPAIWEANAGGDMGGGRTFDDPDLILPGWELDVPIADGIDDPLGPATTDVTDIDVDAATGAIDLTDETGSTADPAIVDGTTGSTSPTNDRETAASADTRPEPTGADATSDPTTGADATTAATTEPTVATNPADGTNASTDPIDTAGGATATTDDETAASADTRPEPTGANATTGPIVATNPADGTNASADPIDGTSGATATTDAIAGTVGPAVPTAVGPDIGPAPGQPTTTIQSLPPADTEPTREPAPSDAVDDRHLSGTGPTMVPALSTEREADVPTATGTTTTTLAIADAGGPGIDANDEGGVGPSAPSPIRIEHAAMLAGGVLAIVAVRRRQRLRAALPRARVPEPRSSASAMERRLRLVDPGERAQRVDVALRAAASKLVGTDSQVGLVTVATDGAVAIRLTSAAALPSPWTGHGASWELPASTPIELISDAARLVGTPCVALAQLGVTADGRDVLIDLEAGPTLMVEGADEATDSIVTGVATALAASPYAEVAHLITVSVPEPAMLGHRNAHRTGSADSAVELATALVGSGRADLEPSFALRSMRTGGEVWEPAVVLLRAADGGDAAARGLPGLTAGGGVAIVAAGKDGGEDGGGSPNRCRLRRTDDGWTFEGFGTTLVLAPVGISIDELDEIDELLEAASAPLLAPDHGPTPAGGPEHWPADEPDPFTPMPYAVVVGLMGEVRVVDVEGRPGTFERSKTVELIAWLTTHRDRSTRTSARTALWELDVRDATFANVVSEARRALARLVPPPDGEEWLARTLTEQLPLHDLVVTDAQLIEQRMDAARLQPPDQAIETLRPAVELIRGLPFAGTSYLWPDAEGLTSSLVLVAIGAAGELAGHALSVGDIDTVFWATGRGLAVLPGHEELIALRMRARARAGDLAGVRQEWESYERVIVADAWSDGEPAPQLLELRRELLS